jgi:hypothetical protein
MVADDDITLGGAATAVSGMGLHADDDGVDGGNMWAKSSLTSGGNMLVRGKNITVDGTASSKAGMLMVADDDITLGGAATAGGSMGLHADDDDVDGGNMWAKSSLTSGSIMVVRGENIQVDGTAVSGKDMLMVADDDVILNDAATAGGDMTLIGDDDDVGGGDVVAKGNLTAGGNIDIYASDTTIIITGDQVQATGDVTLHDNTVLNGGNQRIDAVTGTLITDDGVNVDKSTAGDVDFGGGLGIELGGDVTASGMTDVDTMTFEDDVTANGSSSQRIDAGLGTLVAQDGVDIDKTTASSLNQGNLYLGGDEGIELGGNVGTYDGHLFLEDDVTANGTGDQVFDADGDWKDLLAYGDIIKTTAGNLTLGAGTQPYAQIDLAGDVETTDGDLIFWDKVFATGSDDQVFDADGVGKDLIADDDIIKTTAGDLTLGAGTQPCAQIELAGDATTTDGDLTLWDDVILNGEGDQALEAAQAGYGTLTADGFVWKVTPGDLYLYGDNPGTDAISLDHDHDYCPLLACLPAASTSEGNLELFAPNGDIQIGGDLTTFGLSEDGPGICEWYERPTGGVSVIAENGKIYTAADSPDPEAGDYMLNIGIVGNSDDVTHRVSEGEQLGVDLPWLDEGEEGKAAIVILSRDDLVFGPDTQLIAKGKYDATVIDDRPGVDFLATPGTSIGGVVRDEGDAMDVAIYTGSMGTEEGQGNVHLDGRAIDVEEGGAMVVDAYDTVTFGDFDTFDLSTFDGCVDLACVLIKLALRFHEDIDFEDLCISFEEYADGYEGEDLLEDFLNDYFDEGAFFNIDRMEVSSRITEWLFQAVSNGRLPFAGNPAAIAAFEDFIGGEYVLRGAGLGNPAITDGRAWVLEDPILPPPLYREAGQPAEEQAFGEGGCPALMNWLAGELGIEEDEIEVSVANAFAYSTDIQPCEMCARLRDAATTLEDAEGTGVAGLVQVVNEFVATPAPPSEEQMASIATAFADHTDDGTYYAAAGEWIDALVEYVGILTSEMGYTAEESTAFANKYIESVTDTGNASLTAYVEARLAALGG